MHDLQLQSAMKKHIFHLAWSPESLPTVDAISPLLGFLDARLQDFNGRLLKGNVNRCLHIMWESVLHEIDDHVNSNNSVIVFLLENIMRGRAFGAPQPQRVFFS